MENNDQNPEEEQEEQIEEEIVDDNDSLEEETPDERDERIKELQDTLERERRARNQEKKKFIKKETTEAPKTDGFDYGQLAYLETKGFSSDAEHEIIAKAMKSSGDSLKDVVANEFVIGKIHKMREDAVNAEAQADNKTSKRSGVSAQNKVDYWLKKGELPTDTKLRREVVNAKIELDKRQGVFE